MAFGLTSTVFSCIVVAILGMFQFGFNITAINNADKVIQIFLIQTHGYSSAQMDFIWPTIVSIFCIGGMVGGSIGGWVADKRGR